MNELIKIGNRNLFGRNISIRNGTVTVDGQDVHIDGVSGTNTRELTIVVEVGIIETLTVDGSVQCRDVMGDVDAGGSVHCGNVNGSVDAGGSAHCQSVGGDVDAGGSVSCSTVSGKVKAGGNVSIR